MRPIVFDWDQWNVQKNEQKHGVSRLEAESAFYDPEPRPRSRSISARCA